MNIAFIDTGDNDQPFGHIRELAQELTALGEDVTLYSEKPSREAGVGKADTVRLLHVPTVPPSFLRALASGFVSTLHALFGEYAIIHYHSFTGGLWSFVPKLLKPKVRVVVSLREGYTLSERAGFFGKLFLRIGYAAIRLTTDKRIFSDQAVFQAGASSDKNLVYIPDSRVPDPVFESALVSLSAYGLRPLRYFVMEAGQGEPLSIHHAIKAFLELEGQNKVPNNFKLVVIGDVASEKAYRSYLEVLCAGSRNVVFAGEVSEDVKAILFSSAYAFVELALEYPSESCRRSLANGLLVVVPQRAGYTKEIKKNAAVFVAAEDMEVFKKNLAYFINRPDEAESYRQAAEREGAFRYSREAIAKEIREVYRQALRVDQLKHYAATEK